MILPPKPTPIERICRLIIGSQGSGKTLGNEVDLYLVAREKRAATLFFDSPGDSARRMVGHLSAGGMESRCLLEEARRTDKMLRVPFYRLPTATDALARLNEFRLADEEFAQGFYAKRKLKSGEDKPYTKKWLDMAIRVWRSQPTLPPLPWLQKCFDPGSPEHRVLMTNVSDRDAVRHFAQVEERKYRNPVQYEVETGASQRLLEIVNSPVLWTRFGEDVDWRQLFLDKTQIYYDTSGVTYEEARALTIFCYTAAINTCKRYFLETGQPLPLLIVLEEAGAMDLVTPILIKGMQEWRKAGIAVWVISQTILDFA